MPTLQVILKDFSLIYDSKELVVLHCNLLHIFNLSSRNVIHVHMHLGITSQYLLSTGNSHWVCISMLNQEVRLMDSLPLKTVEDHLILQIASMYKCDGHILTIQRLPVQIQQGNKDCGVFSIAYALEVCIGNDTTASCFDQTRMRDHLKQCLLRGQLRPFPKIRLQI